MNFASFIGVSGNTIILCVVGEINKHASYVKPLPHTHKNVCVCPLCRRILFPRNLFGQDRENDSKQQEINIKKMKS